jgi:hypothetical protein
MILEYQKILFSQTALSIWSSWWRRSVFCCEVGTDLQAPSHSREKRILALSCPSVCQQVSEQHPLDGFPWNLILGRRGVKKICRESQSLVKIGQKRWALYTKTQVCFIVTGDIDSAIKHRTALSICMLLTVTSSSIYTECIVGLPLQRRLHERATMLHYTYIACLVETDMRDHHRGPGSIRR